MGKKRKAKTQARESTAELRALEAGRLDSLQLAHWPQAMSGDLQATRAVLDVMQRRAELFGLELQPKRNPDPDSDAEIDQVLDTLIEGMDAESALAAIRRFLSGNTDDRAD